MSAPRLTIRVQLQQDHGFSRPLFHKSKPRRWPWLLLLLLLGGGAVLLWLQPELIALPPQSSPQQIEAAPVAVTTPLNLAIVADQAAPVVAEAVAAEPAVVEATALAVAAEPANQPEMATPEPQAVVAVAETAVAEPAAVEPVVVEPVITAVEPAAAATAATPVAEEPTTATAAPLAASAEQGADPRIARQLLTAAINNREPVGQLNGPLAAPVVVYFFNELKEMQGEQVSHRWYRDDQLVRERTINVGAVRWRTWSRHEIGDKATGQWRVELVDSSGKLLASQQWLVTGSMP